MFDVLEQNRIFEPKCLEPFKNLKDFMDRFGVSGATLGITLPSLGKDPGPWGHPGVGGAPVGWVPDAPLAPLGPREGGCLHEVQPFPEDAHQQQDGQVGQQEGVGGSAWGEGSRAGGPDLTPPSTLHCGVGWAPLA